MLAPFYCATPDPMELPNHGKFQMLLWHLAFQLELYHAPFDTNFPLVCMDESSKQVIGEVELSVLQTQCLNRRIADQETLRTEVAIWGADRNNRSSKTQWYFTTAKACIKLKRFYPKL